MNEDIQLKERKMHNLITHALMLLMLWLGGSVHAGEVTYIYTDAQGTPLAEADANGNIIAQFDYMPYGVPVPSMDPAPDGPGYTGHVNDPDTGLVYMQARYYDPAVGRFLSVDPVTPSPGNTFNFNRYNYANNNPLRYTDPDGQVVETAWDVFNIALGVDSFAGNVRAGDWSGATLDATGIIVDAAAAILPVVPGGAGTALKVSRAVDKAGNAGKEAAAANRAENIAKGISERQLGPSGKPKIHVVEKSTIKQSKDAARASVGKGGTTIKHQSPQKGGPHHHGVSTQGEKNRVHYEYPKNKQ